MINKYYTDYKIKSIDKTITFILIAMLAIIPIITSRYSSTYYSPIYLNNIYGTSTKSDLFNFFKTIAIYIGSFSVIGLFLYRTIKLEVDIKNNKLNIAIIALVISILISTLFSNYKDIALFGSSDRFEGSLSWLCQIGIFFVLLNISIEKKYYKYFYFALYPFLIINTITSVATVVYGQELVANKFVHFLIGGEGRIAGNIYTTLYNQNFGSGVCGLIFGISFMYLLLEKDIKKKLIILIGVILSFVSTICLVSNSGFLTILVLVPITIVIGIRFRGLKNTTLWSAIVLAINVISFKVITNTAKTKLGDWAFDRIYNDSIGFIEKINSISNLIIPIAIIGFVALVILMKFINRKKFFNITSIIAIGIISICVVSFGVILNNQEKQIAKQPNTNIERIYDKEIFKKFDAMTTGRLYIWSKTIDKIVDNPISGYGFDTFPYEFIPNDVDGGKIDEYGTQIDKPHNWYLSIAYGGGIISLIGVLCIIYSVIKKSFYNISDKIDNKYIYIFAIGVIGYAIQGIFNDSFPGTLLIFWMMCGLSLNILKENTDIQ